MRFAFILLLVMLSAPALAAEPAPDAAGKPLPAAPSPPPPPDNYNPPAVPDLPNAGELEPEITITTKGTEIHEEYRLNGRLYMIKVIPKKGKPYYLIDQEGSGQFRRSDFEPRIAIPTWVIKRF
ncbi:MAG: DUF2782 domain-containing protein [Gammaproteobacteria bacterium]|nr:DUF2782 domain-containing protein [Gammaproteobacteria bacterium]MDH5511857.1 DUF2782 domain-containing protein [Gammaproteobacteria bacterium]